VWSKDRALVLAAPRTQLTVPLRPDPKWRERFNDWATLSAVARAMPETYLVNEVPLEYDAGDFAVTGDQIVVDVNLLVKNQKHGPSRPRRRSVISWRGHSTGRSSSSATRTATSRPSPVDVHDADRRRRRPGRDPRAGRRSSARSSRPARRAPTPASR